MRLRIQISQNGRKSKDPPVGNAELGAPDESGTRVPAPRPDGEEIVWEVGGHVLQISIQNLPWHYHHLGHPIKTTM